MPYVGTPHEYLNYTRLAYDKFSGIVMNGQTLDMSRSYPRGSFQDIFGWIKYATPGGDVVYNQTTCQAWSLYAPSSNASLYLLTTGTPSQIHTYVLHSSWETFSPAPCHFGS